MSEAEQPASPPEVSIRMPTFHGAELIEGTLGPLCECDSTRVEIVVSDHSLSDSTTDLTQRLGRSRSPTSMMAFNGRALGRNGATPCTAVRRRASS